MPQAISLVSLLVRDYDEAIAFYRDKLGFALLEDTRIDESKRWVVMSPRGAGQCGLLLARASNAEQQACVGNQTAGRVFLFLNTDNIDRDLALYHERGVSLVRQPVNMPYGRVAVFKDLYGNLWDLIQPAHANGASAA